MKDRLYKFLIVGCIATAIQYLTLILLVEVFTANAVLSSATGFIVSAFANYALNYRYTFQSTLPHRNALPKYFLTALVGLMINTGTMHFFVEFIRIHYVLSQIVATSITLIWHFMVNSLWSFSDPAARDA